MLAYYVLLWAAQKGLELRAKGATGSEVTAFLYPLLDQIESTRKRVQLPASGQDYVLERSCRAFIYADDLDRAGRRDKATAAAFRAAALIFESLRQFAELPEEISTRMKVVLHLRLCI